MKIWIIIFSLLLVGCEFTTVLYEECVWAEPISISEEGKGCLTRQDKEQIAYHNLSYKEFCQK